MSAKRTTTGREVRVVSAEFEAGASTVDALPEPLSEEVAFVGRSNVGKSSLMNALVERRKLVRTSSTPGCTRQINLFAVKLADGRELRLVDLPGYGYAKLSKTERQSWGAKLEAYIRTRVTLGCVVLLVDARRGFQEDDAQMVEFLSAERPLGPPPRIVVVATKLDKVASSKRLSAIDGITRQAGAPAVGFSAVTGVGRGELWAEILNAGLGPVPLSPGQKPGPKAAGEDPVASLASSSAVR